MLVCLYEDRLQQIAGLKILLLSLSRYCPSWPIRLRFPKIGNDFRKWLERIPQLVLVSESLSLSGSYDVKPTVLLDGFKTGARVCLWLDTDVLINGSLEFLATEDKETIILTQDPWEYVDGSTYRSKAWGFTPGRALPGPLNSALVRATEHHIALLEAWQSVLTTDQYLREQAKPIRERNRLMLGDQDAISALLASESFASIPVRRLLHASEILQHHGAGAYAAKQRLENLRHGAPPIIHAMGTIKPWKMKDRPTVSGEKRDYYERVYLELSPYVHFARQYRSLLQEKHVRWLDLQTFAGRISTILTFNQPVLKGSLQALLHKRLSGK